METYAQQKQWADAARLARALGKAERAAGYFAEAAMPFEAAECYLQCRNRDRALASLWQVTAAHPRYREPACTPFASAPIVRLCRSTSNTW